MFLFFFRVFTCQYHHNLSTGSSLGEMGRHLVERAAHTLLVHLGYLASYAHLFFAA